MPGVTFYREVEKYLTKKVGGKPMIKQRRFVPFSLLLLLIVLLSACGGTQGGGGAQPAGGNGMIDKLDGGAFGGGDNPQVNYNPFSPNALISGYLYEPLMVQNSYNCQVVPWLATDYKWQDPQTLIFTIRDGIKWSDGQPFGPDDVVFTLNLLQKYPALDSNGLWKSLTSVAAQGNQVTLKFKVPSVQIFTRVLSVPIVSSHVWGKVDDPAKFTDDKPVVTGPFLPESFNQQQLVLKRNPNYWQADKIRIERLVFHKSSGGNEVENLKLAQGVYDWNAMFVPNVEQAYVAKDPKHNHYWFPAGGEISLGMNLKRAPFNDLEFRRAMAYAIDREEISKKAVFGYVKPASQTGLSVPGQKDFLPADIPNMGIFPFDQKQALDILDKAGYKKNASGKILGKDGKPLELTFLVQNGWTDWIQASQIIQANLGAMGITINVQTPSPEIIESRRAAADYDIVFSVHGGSCSMYDNYNYLDSRVDSTVNYIHHKNPEVDKMLDQLQRAVTMDEQKQVVAQLAKYSYENFPDVPLWYGPNWFEFSTKKAVGWPSADDPYAKPGDILLIFTRLKPSPDYKPSK
ncbi:MAG: ABC transporter substrate-binding protein [Ktedonobacteraceae bacterium]|nr:ABC transporter substrate-binding protein [Ktedonobacteraceae bacterium]